MTESANPVGDKMEGGLGNLLLFTQRIMLRVTRSLWFDHITGGDSSTCRAIGDANLFLSAL